jgi:hypothetical protein
MPAYVGFSARAYNPFSWLIRKVTKSKYSHTFVLLADPNNSIDVPIIHASGLTVQRSDLRSQMGRGTCGVVYKIDCTIETEKEALSYVLKFEDEPYGYLQLVGFLFVLVFRLRKRNPISKGVVCSELLWRLLNALHIPGIELLDRDTITPDQGENLLLSTPGVTVASEW